MTADRSARDAPVVVGGGWAGCAAAVTLARLGHRVVLYEAGATLGGRARRVVRAGLALDNGPHLLIGAYRQTRKLVASAHGPSAASALLARGPLSLVPISPRQPHALSLVAPAWPAPFGLLAGLLRAKGLTIREKLGVTAWYRRLQRAAFRTPQGQTVAELVASGPSAAAERLWGPLCVAALNTPPTRACAQTFANVLRATFDGAAQDADFLLPRTDLSALFPDAAARLVEEGGGRVALGSPVVVESLESGQATLRIGQAHARASVVIIAVGPHQLWRVFDAAVVASQRQLRSAVARVEALEYEPIVNVWLGYPSTVGLPAPLVRLDDAPGQWCFDRPDILARAHADANRPHLAQLLCVVISAHGPHDATPHATLAAQCDLQLRRLLPALPNLAWSQTIAERRATYACVPGRPRPATIAPHPRLLLAGDYMDAELPATIEAATRSGIAAAIAADAAL